MKPGFSPTGSVNLVCYHGILQGPSPVTALDFLYLELAGYLQPHRPSSTGQCPLTLTPCALVSMHTLSPTIIRSL